MLSCCLFLWHIKDSRPSRERLYDCAAEYMTAAGLAAPLPPLRREERGKPYFEGTPFHFSISHSGEWWACAFGPSPLGLDIQRMDDTRDRQAVARRFFHPDEADYLAGRGRADFYRIWCAKEAWVKYTGEGISGLRLFCVVETGRVTGAVGGIPLIFPAPPENYMLALFGCKSTEITVVEK